MKVYINYYNQWITDLYNTPNSKIIEIADKDKLIDYSEEKVKEITNLKKIETTLSYEGIFYGIRPHKTDLVTFNCILKDNSEKMYLYWVQPFHKWVGFSEGLFKPKIENLKYIIAWTGPYKIKGLLGKQLAGAYNLLGNDKLKGKQIGCISPSKLEHMLNKDLLL